MDAVGSPFTVIVCVPIPLPSALVTVITPETAVDGVMVMDIEETTVNGTLVDPIFTAVTLSNPVPVIVIVPFTQAEVGVTEVTVGGLPELYKSVVAKNG
jgi:hypothetical protein